jgi:DNA primase
MDVIACHRAEVPNVIATLGTAMTLTHARYLSHIVDKVYLCFDGDTAGQTALAKASALLKSVNVETVAVKLPQDCKDPDEVFVKMGAEALRSAIF